MAPPTPRDLRPRFHPVAWDSDALRILDQTLLPRRERWRRLRTVAQVREAIRALRVRGAPLIGIAAAYGLALAARRGEPFARAAQRLATARPTAVNLRWAVERVLAAGPARALAEARAIHREEIERCARIALHGARLIPRGARVLTICNTGTLATGGIGTAFGVAVAARARLIACETRPLSQGARLTMWEARRYGLDATLIVDGAAAALMARGEVDVVITGADRIAANGDTANKIGTYALAVLAAAHRIPFFVAAPTSTLDPRTPSGAEIPIEERDGSEVCAGVRARNPAFDVTPHELITAWITQRGLERPPFR